jgi:hypothetical protein
LCQNGAVKYAVAIAVLMLAPFAALREPQPAEASTCSYLSPPNPWDRFTSALTYKLTSLIVVGVVTEEIKVESARNDRGRQVLVPSKDQSLAYDERGHFQSTVRVEAVLKGDPSVGEVVLPYLADEVYCTEGARLHVGQRVLLVLHEEIGWYDPQIGGYNASWQTGRAGSPILLQDGHAFMADQSADGRRFGSAEEVIRLVAAASGSSPREESRALASLSRPASTGGGGLSTLLKVLVMLLPAAALAAYATALRPYRSRARDAQEGPRSADF